MTFRTCTIDKLQIEDEAAFVHIPHYAALKELLRRTRYRFRCLSADSEQRWDRALLLNLTFWGGGDGDVLSDGSIAADVVTHAAWHRLAATDLLRLGAHGSADALLFGEAVASGYDVYLIGRLLRAGAHSSFLDTQVAALSESASAAGLSAKKFAALLQAVADDPDQAFEDLRALLFSASTSLLRARTPDRGLAILEKLGTHRFAPILHHYELSTWVLYARAYAPTGLQPIPAVRALDRRLRKSQPAAYLTALLALASR